MENFPNLQLNLLGGNPTTIGALAQNKRLIILVFYRGFHCSICHRYIHRWSAFYDDFLKLGVEVVAISTDIEAKARQAQREWFTGSLPMAYDFPTEEGKKLGMYVAHGEGPGEPQEYLQPALYVLNPNLELLALSIQSTAYARPDISALYNDIRLLLQAH
jgi:peroxiredoxin